MKALQVIDQAFRTTTEEQDDTILWLTLSMRGAGGDLSLLLSGHAAYYAVQRGTQPALTLGDWRQTQPANLTRDLGNLVARDVPVYVVDEDLEERGLQQLPLLDGVRRIARRELADLYDSVDQVWHW
ncbi:MAG TPA: DsrE family protein [Hyphomicrobiales bacterium]|nr:DsrE family protein [Hyphomicrobiales bacterium]